jgi:hypothetical protein
MTAVWGEKLRQAFGGKRVRFPTGFQLKDEDGTAVIEMAHDGVTRNLQSNAAAFEAWALVLHRWCGAQHVALRWQPVEVQERLEADATRWPPAQLHYQRFLYRLLKFDLLFGADWFQADAALARAQSRCRDGAMFLNAPGARVGTKPKDKPEARIEWELLHGPGSALKTYCDSPVRWLPDRQIPVGLFTRDVPMARHAIFPGGAGAIDLAALGDDRLWLFELKADGNMPLGTLSEILFYTAVMRDLCTGAIRPARAAAVTPDKLTAPAMAAARRITGVMLAPRLHPLLDEDLLDRLNGAIAKTWNTAPGAPRVDIEAAILGPAQLARRGKSI